VFWRQVGIRLEATAVASTKGYVHYDFYTVEAFLCHVEIILRRALRTFKLPAFELEWFPALVTPGSTLIVPGHYRLSIASDTSGIDRNGTGATLTTAYTTGALANGLMIVGNLHNSGDHITATSYSLVGMANSNKANTRGGMEAYIWWLAAPASGGHNVVSTSDGTAGEVDHGIATYSGAKQTGFPDSSVSDTTSNTTSSTFAFTTVADKCWAFIIYTPNNATVSVGTNATLLQNNIPTGDMAIFDNSGHGAITPAGSFSMTCNASSATQSRGIGVSFAPFVASATVLPLFIQQAVNRASTY
jgi:hypothetical protein